MRRLFGLLLLGVLFASAPALAQGGDEKDQKEGEKKAAGPMSAATFSGLKLRSIGPALTSGRISDFAIDPENRARYYVATSSGGVWKTVNAGVTWTPVFDKQGSYSIGAIALDPNNPEVVWVGAGENNAQRSVSYGDGVYKSEDGGKTWKNKGLKKSEHIARILIDPNDSNTVYVAAQGPLWSAGGDRGLFKTTDGGETWEKVLEISEHTGVTDAVMDPRNPSVLYAAAWQRRRRVWTLIAGGPESALYKTTDGGKNWKKLKSGLPSGQVGRIGLAISPADPDVVYAIIEASENKGGIFRSANRGATWEKRSGTSTSGNYYQEIVADPKDVDRLYIMNTRLQVSDDGGKTVRGLGERWKHVDNHAMWIDPNNTDYYLVGCDGGVYESFDRGVNWDYKANLPVTQFYDIALDNSEPFYYVYGGTQDNFTLGGPSRTRNVKGISNDDWFVAVGGDGFKIQVDPEDPNIVYGESQYGGLVRHDRRTGEITGIKPVEEKGAEALRWNWDSPLLISPHSNTRIYFGANRLFRSDDRGNTWRAVSGDLTRQMDRDQLKVMGRVWEPEAVARARSTSFYGTLTAVAESPLQEGLIYAGTDDGLIQVTEDGGANWRKIETLPGVPERTYVQRLLASQHDARTVYAVLNNHKSGDFAPYLLKSTDAGQNWTSVTANLPENHSLHAIAEDHVNPNLLFVGTEFGLFFTADGGKKWVQLKGGLPTVAVRDLAIQKRENDLALATFGRGFYILDDYTPLRSVTPESLEGEGALFPVKEAKLYIQDSPLGGRGKAFQGASFFTTDNPPFGATFTYYQKESPKTRKQRRQAAEKEAVKKKEDRPFPSLDDLRAEAEEQPPAILLTIADSDGRVIRRLQGSTKKGMQRVTWDLRYPASVLPPERSGGARARFGRGRSPSGPLVVPGNYQVTLSRRVGGETTVLAGPELFTISVLGASPLAAADRPAMVAFHKKVAELQRAVIGANSFAGEVTRRLSSIKRALRETPAAPEQLTEDALALEKRLREIQIILSGDRFLRTQNRPAPPGILQRVSYITSSQRRSTSQPTQTQRDSYRIASEEFAQVLTEIRALVETDLKSLEDAMEAAGAPWTPGRLPKWTGQQP